MVTIKHLKKDIADFEDKKNQIENEIEEEQRYYSDISIKKEKAIMSKGRLQIGDDEGEALMIEQEIQEYDSILKKNEENIILLEDKIEFYNKKIISLDNAVEEVNNEDIRGLDLSQVNSVQSAKTLLIAFFNIVLEVKVSKMDLEDTLMDQHNSLAELEKELRVLRESKRTCELEFNRALQKREKEYRELENKLRQETEAQIDETQIQMSTNPGLTSLEAKRMEKKKNEKNISVEAYEDSKRKLSKMMSELERKLVVEEKKNLAMANMIDQSKAEKEQYKQKYTNLRKKIKQDECDQMRMNKMASMESTPYGVISIPENHSTSNTKLSDYKDMRKDRKIVKKINESGPSNSNTDSLSSFLGSEVTGNNDKRSSLWKNKQVMSVEQSNSNVFDRLLNRPTITSKIKERAPINYGKDEYDSLKSRSNSFNLELEGIGDSELLWN